MPDETEKELAARSDLSPREPDPEALLSTLRERKRRTGSRLPAETVIAHRDADRR